MKKKYLFGCVLFLALLITGCSFGGTNSNSDVQKVNFRTGSQGLYMEFVPNMPPSTVYALEPLDLMIKYYNKGATDIKEGFIYVSGYDTTFLSNLYDPLGDKSRHVFNDLPGKNEYNPYGDVYDTASFKDGAGILLPTGVDNFQMTFKATACYLYETIASAKVCVDPNPANLNVERKVCQVHDIGMATQGAPVAITSVKEQVNRNDLLFWIYFKNVGTGDVFVRETSPDNVLDCNSNLNFDDINKVQLESIEISGNQIEGNCRPEGTVQRINQNGYGQVLCICKDCIKSTTDAYETLLTIKLKYGYRDSIQKSITVRRNPWNAVS